MIICGIDPGPKESGYVVWDGKEITDYGTMDNEGLLHWLIARHWGMHVRVAIEWIVGYGLTVGCETFDCCRWVGRFEQAAGRAALISRKQIKSHLCSSIQAKDQHIRQALIDRIGPQGTKKSPGPTFGITGHAWAALAVAVTYWDTCRVEEE